MARPPVLPAEEKVWIVLSALAGEASVAEAARKAKVSGQPVGNWEAPGLGVRPRGTGRTDGRSLEP